ncbi:MAG: sensor histidine kinase, partial [Betaproteobacteria bacterium]
ATSLRLRLLALTVLGVAVALLMAGVVLSGMFRDAMLRQFQQGLEQQLDQLMARVSFDAQGQPQVDDASLSDPRWQRPYSGLYWQINGADQSMLLRSRSLWDVSLTHAPDLLSGGALHVHPGVGPRGASLLVLERVVRPEAMPDKRWRLLVAGDTQAVDAAVARIRGMLALALGVLLVLLLLAGWAQVALGLAPLRVLQRAMADLREGREKQIRGPVPQEVQPLVDGFNAVLARNTLVIERARQQNGNLAHAVKTPLAVLAQAAEAVQKRHPPADQGATADTALSRLVIEQVALARRQVDWHLARARAAGALAVVGQRVAVEPVLRGLLRVMDKVHAGRALQLHCDPVGADIAFAGEEQDLQEMLGNLLDNACKWARHAVQVQADVVTIGDGVVLQITVQDDGPGIAPEQRDAVLARGVRIDESVPGSGLGLAIVGDLVRLYAGSLTMDSPACGGLLVRVRLPAAT